MKKTSPLVSVVLPVYNAGQYLKDSITSILNQSYSNLEVIICDDASTDQSLAVIQSFTDERITVIKHSTNRGLVATLNESIQAAAGTYIARMDNDDIAHPERLAKQLSYLELHPEIALVGCLYARIDSKGEIIKIDPVVTTSAEVALALGVKNCFCHGSVTLNRKAIPASLLKYSEKYKHAEDYYLWSTFAQAGLKLANLPEVLYFWRSHESSISKVAHEQQSNNALNLIEANQLLRSRTSATELCDFAYKGLFSRPSSVHIAGTQYSSNLALDHQYILYRWGALMWARAPILAVLSWVLSFSISPLSIIKSILKRN